MANHLSRAEQLAVLHPLVEGCSLRSITRLTGVHRTTIMNLLAHVGTLCENFHDRWMCNLTLAHLECDEIWTFVRKKQAHLTPAESANVSVGDQFLFVAIDETTKLIPSYLLGKRTAANATAFAVDLAGRLVLPGLFDIDRPRPRLSTDGFTAYPNAIETAFGGVADHGVIIKDFQESEQPGRYGPPEMVSAIRQIVSGTFSRWDICTSHVERHNLSIRTFMRRFTRLALGFSKKLENLKAAIHLYIAHYNFCRMHGSLPGTPAMASRIAGHPWTLAELLDRLEEGTTRPAPFGLFRRRWPDSGVYGLIRRQAPGRRCRCDRRQTVGRRDGDMTPVFDALAGRRFGAILLDPPWRFQNRTGKMAPEHKRLRRYPTMSFEEIAALPVGELAKPQSHLYLWCPNALLLEALTIMKAWGFNYKTNLVWYKIRKDGGPDGRGVGFYFRNVTELLLFGVRGKLRTLKPGRTQVNVIITRKEEHSRKPEAAYEIIEACSPAPFLELFARLRRPGWEQWGDQVDSYAETRPLFPAYNGSSVRVIASPPHPYKK